MGDRIKGLSGLFAPSGNAREEERSSQKKTPFIYPRRRGFTLVELVVVVAILGLLAALGVSRMHFFTLPPEGMLQKTLLYAKGEARKNFAPFRLVTTSEGEVALHGRVEQEWRMQKLPWKSAKGWVSHQKACYVYPDGTFSPALFTRGAEKNLKRYYVTVTGNLVVK